MFPARHIDQGKEQISNFSGKLKISLGALDFVDLFLDLIENAIDRRPIETDARGAVLILLCLTQSWYNFGNAI